MYQVKNDFKPVSRRAFLRGFCKIGACATVLSTTSSYACIQTGSAQQKHVKPIEKVRKSIQASFGSNFRVLSFESKNGYDYAVIEHSENRYSVVSADMNDWKILEATEM